MNCPRRNRWPRRNMGAFEAVSGIILVILHEMYCANRDAGAVPNSAFNSAEASAGIG